MGFFSNLFGGGSSEIEVYLEKGAMVLDVRTAGEFQGGHVKGAKNIPLQSVESNLSAIKKWNKPVIVCCASGMRSGQAHRFLKSNGVDCINGGGWTKVNGAVSKV
jgi:phage shock protein E